MPAQANLKSAAITSLDATPIVAPTAGKEGGAGRANNIVGIVGPTTDGATTGGVLRAVRVKSNVKVRSIKIAQVAATTTASFDMGLYYSDSTTDGTSYVNIGDVIDADRFATGVDTHALTSWTEEAFEAGTFTVASTVKELWDAAGLSSDPGGYFDICLTNTATIADPATLAVMVEYVE